MSFSIVLIKKILRHSSWVILLIPVFSFCQIADNNGSDSIVIEHVKVLDLSEISKKSAELTLKTKTIRRKVIKDKELEKIDIENNKMIQFIDSLLLKEQEVEFSTLGARNLQNKLIDWKEKGSIIHDQIKILNDLFIGIDKDVKKLY